MSKKDYKKQFDKKNQSLGDNGFSFTSNSLVKVPDSKIIKVKVSSTGALILPDDAPQDVKDWVENG